MCGKGPTRQKSTVRGKLNLQEYADDSSYGERNHSSEYGKMRYSKADVKAPQYDPYQETNDCHEHWRAKDRASNQVAAEKGKDVHRDGERSEDAQCTNIDYVAWGRFTLSKEPEAHRQHTECN